MSEELESISTSDVVEYLTEAFPELPKKSTKEIVATFLGLIEEYLTEGHKVRLDHVGIFEVRERPARMGRNPKTGEEIKIPKTRRVAFRAARKLKDFVAGKITEEDLLEQFGEREVTPKRRGRPKATAAKKKTTTTTTKRRGRPPKATTTKKTTTRKRTAK